MNNELVKITNNLACGKAKEVAREVMTVCRAITPQFYKNASLEEMQAERLSIELLTADIEQPVLAEMCRRAIRKYALERSENAKTYFDMNYILTFYKDAFNHVNCESVQLSSKAEYKGGTYDEETQILTETWIDNGQEVIVREICKKPRGNGIYRIYSSKFHKSLYTPIDEIEI